PHIPGYRGLIDPDTPKNAKTRRGFDGDEYELVFSDEFNQNGRTFWPGDDPYWEAADIHYWPTGDQEWYDPDGAVTKDGFLVITLSEMDPDINHNLNYRSGMLTSWNKMCFTGGYFEVSLILPGSNEVGGFWPAVWTMGNLARAGYGGTTEGLWPYSYNSCDVGAMPNQTDPNTGAPGPSILTSVSDLSWQPGQRLSRCTCKGEDHPGDKNSDGTYKGRASPEIDILEAYSYEKSATGFASQSLQVAPYDANRQWTTKQGETYQSYTNPGIKTTMNSYHGGNRQQTASFLSTIPTSNCKFRNYWGSQMNYREIKLCNTGVNGYQTWSIGDKPTWTLNNTGIGANSASMIGERLVSNEPMYMILNLGISDTFVPVNKARLNFPAKMLIDYVRVYQPKGRKNVGCSPKDYPTEDYINRHLNAYLNVNITTWAQANQTFPKNSMMDGCSQPTS
ncbi:family 16 glycoside hydrolase, partial [Melampsora larici-populina 98AG31]